jgi:glucose/arabinose dehydrogenase
VALTIYVSDNNANSIQTYQFTASGNASPAASLSASNGSLNVPNGEAFDAHGDLRVANEGANTVVEYTPSQLAATGAPTPAVTISASGVGQPIALAFDASGALWVARYAPTATASVVEF